MRNFFGFCWENTVRKAALIWLIAMFMLLTETCRDDKGANIGCKTVTGRKANHWQPLIWGSWTRYGVWSVVGSQFSGVPSRTRLLLFEATPGDSLNDIGDPSRLWEGNQNRRHSHHSFPPSILARRWESKSSCGRHASLAFPTSISPCVLKSSHCKKVTASHRHISKEIKSQRSV